MYLKTMESGYSFLKEDVGMIYTTSLCGITYVCHERKELTQAANRYNKMVYTIKLRKALAKGIMSILVFVMAISVVAYLAVIMNSYIVLLSVLYVEYGLVQLGLVIIEDMFDTSNAVVKRRGRLFDYKF